QLATPYVGDPLRGVSGALLRPKLQTVLRVDFGQGIQKDVPFVIIDSPVDFILGTDFITKHVDAHYPKQGVIVIDGVRFNVKTRLKTKPAIQHLAATQWVTIPVDHAAKVPVRTFYKPPELASLTTPIDLTLRYHFLAEDGILAAGNWSTHRDEYFTASIFVRNVSSKPIHLRPGQTLAVLTPERLSDVDLLSPSSDDLLSTPRVPSTSKPDPVPSTPDPSKDSSVAAALRAPTSIDLVPSTTAPSEDSSVAAALRAPSLVASWHDALVATDRTEAVTPARDS
ncbi:hypothetical protein HK102_010516, partial [Quaeritorhiza haematococci]